MKKVDSKGFTLIELLAVITIMGILMLVAIPAVSRTIENSRRDTFMDIAKAYANSVINAVAADELICINVRFSARPEGYYFVKYDSAKNSGQDLVEHGGKSSWGGAEVRGIVVIHKIVTNTTDTSGNPTGSRNSYEYYTILADSVGRGLGEANSSNGNITRLIPIDELSRSDVKTDAKLKKYYENFDSKIPGNYTILSKTGTTKGSNYLECVVEM